MTAKEAINKISVMLGVAPEGETAETQVELAKATLVDGTEVYCENDFAEGEQLFVVTEEGNIPAPEGSHETEDGRIITVDAGGKIGKVEEKVEAEDEIEEEVEAELTEESTDVSLSEEVVSSVMDALNKISDSISALETRLNETEQEFHEFRNEPGGKKITNNLNEVQKTHNDLASARFNKILEFRRDNKF